MMECGDCTVCCTLSVVESLKKKAWEQCTFCTNNGCDIYGDHPKECKDFECAYLQGGKDVKLRPDKCGIMFIKKSERIFCGMLVPDVLVTDIAKRQINSFRDQGYSVIMLKPGERPHIVCAKDHNDKTIHREYVNILNNGNL